MVCSQADGDFTEAPFDKQKVPTGDEARTTTNQTSQKIKSQPTANTSAGNKEHITKTKYKTKQAPTQRNDTTHQKK